MPKRRKLPENCAQCQHWQLSQEFGYRICELTNIAGSPKKLPAECPLHGREREAAYA